MLNDTQLNHILEDFDIAYWKINLRTREIFWSDHFAAIVGQQQKETDLFEFFLNQILHQDYKYDFRASFDDLIKDSKPFSTEIRLKLVGEKYRWFECRSLNNNKEQKADTAVLLFMNIHQSKRDQYTIEENFFYYRETAEITNTGGWYVDIKNKIIYWDQVTKRILECPLDYEPKYDDKIHFYASENKEKIFSILKKCQDFGIPFKEEFKMLTLHNKEKWVRATGKPVYNKDQEIIGMRGVLQDIDAEKITDLNLQNALNIVASQNSKLFNFSHIISHNLRSHSSNLSLVVQLLQEAKTNKDKLELMANVENISENIEHAILQLNNLVSAKDSFQVEKKKVKFSEILDSVINATSSLIRRENAKIVADFEDLKEIEYISEYLESILLNLLSNAIHYKYPGRRPIIYINTYKKDNYHYLEVNDNGQGIDLSQEGNKMFGINASSSTPHGNGIGLFITKKQIEALGGEISVSSTVDIGTTFKIKF